MSADPYTYPRTDHRTVIVRFANSTDEQIDRIARLGCIVSANSYYPVGFGDQYAAHRLGADRADTMVRAGSVVLRRGTPQSFHSGAQLGWSIRSTRATFLVWPNRSPSGSCVTTAATLCASLTKASRSS